MSGARHLIERIMIDKLLCAPPPLSGLEKIKQFLAALSITFLIIGLVFLVYGAHMWLLLHYNEDMAAIITGLISLALSIVITSMLLGVIYYHKMLVSKMHQKLAEKIKSSLSMLEIELGDPVKENPKMAIIIASLLGFLGEDKIFDS